MNTFPLRPVAARLLPVIVTVLALTSVPRARAQYAQPGVDSAGFYEQGDEMSKRVGGFLRRMFYGEDRNSMYAPPQGAPPPPRPSGRTAPPAGMNYEYAPPPEPQGRPIPRPSSQVPVDEQPRAVPSRRSPAHIAEPEQPRHKETVTPSRPSTKRATVQDAPPKHVEEPGPKSSTRIKNYTPPKLHGDDPPAPKLKAKSSGSSSSASDDPPEAKPKRKSSPPVTHDEVTETKPKHKTSSSPPASDDVAETKPRHKTSPASSSSDQDLSFSKNTGSGPKETVVMAPTPERLSKSKTEPTQSASAKTDPDKISPYAEDSGHGSVTSSVNERSKSKSSTPPTEEPKKKDKADETPAPSVAGSPGVEPKFPAGTRSDHAGRVISPYPPHNELDVSGLTTGSLAVDPTTGKVFRVP